MSGHYYDYKSLNPATINNQYPPWHWENPADWPRTFLYIPNQDGVQGLHPPAPVYQSNQPSQQAMYYFPVSLHIVRQFIVVSLTSHFRVVPALQLVTMSTASTTEPVLPLPQPVGLTPPTPPLLATLAIPSPRLLLQSLLRTIRTHTHHIAQHQLPIKCPSPSPRSGLELQVQDKLPPQSLPMPPSQQCPMPQHTLSELLLLRFKLKMPSCSPTCKLPLNSQANSFLSNQVRARSFGARNSMEVGL